MILLWKSLTNFITKTNIPDQKSLIYRMDKNDVQQRLLRGWGYEHAAEKA